MHSPLPRLLHAFLLPQHRPRSCKPGEPVDLLQLPFANDNLHFVLVNPKFEAPTAQMRAVLPKEVPMKSWINNSSQGGALVGTRVASTTACGACAMKACNCDHGAMTVEH